MNCRRMPKLPAAPRPLRVAERSDAASDRLIAEMVAAASQSVRRSETDAERALLRRLFAGMEVRDGE